MGLQVWLPLNGNLNNQGLNRVSFTVNKGTPTIENGKIGNCYTFTNGTQIKSATTISTSNYKNISICAWVKNTYSDASWSRIGGLNSHTFCHLDIRAADKAVRFFLSKDGTSNAYDYVMSTTFLTDNKWHHVCGVVDENKLYIYIDGVLENTANRTSSYIADSSNVWVGSLNNGRDLQGSLNDFRIYDEALSKKQVKEISKCLIMHYPLKGVNANPNLIPASFASNSGWGTNGSANTFTKLSDYSFSIKYTAETITGAAGRYKSINGYFTEGKTYTFSYEIKGDGAYEIKAGFEPSPNYITTTTEFKRYFCTYTATTTGWCAIVFYSNGTSNNLTTGSTITIRNMKLEEGNICTNYIPSSADAIYTTLGYSNKLAVDDAGYNYRAILSNGTFLFSTDSPRYGGCTNFSTNTCYLQIPTINMSGFANSFTIAYWEKVENMSGKMAWGFEDGNRLNIYPTGSVICCNTGDSANNPYQKDGTSIGFSQWNNGWHHFVMTADGTNNKLYVDGELQGISKTYKGITGTKLYISGWASNTTNYRWTNGSLSDFRVYATPLSAEDVLTLYQDSGIIDKKNGVYAYEFKEE